jgi:hypothetical protein
MQQQGKTEGDTLLAVRRRFLIDLAWPMETTDLADMFGLPPSSEDVADEEVLASHATIKRLIETLPAGVVAGPAADMAKLIVEMQTDDLETLTAWLLSYTLAVISMVETMA